MRAATPVVLTLALVACRSTDPEGEEIGDSDSSEGSTDESSEASTGESSESTDEMNESTSETADETSESSESTSETTGTSREGGSLRFFGYGVAAPKQDRVLIPIDDPRTTDPGPPADVGATDFTIELWLRADPGSNDSSPVACGANVAWINGNIVVDRDRFNQDRKLGLSLAAGSPVFGVSGQGTGDRTICAGDIDLRDGEWHHLAVQRRRSDGRMWLFVDGELLAEDDGPDGDISYPDDGVPGDFCGGPCLESDPFLVLAAEKHDAGPEYPSFAGWLDELRISTVLRYAGPFTPASEPFVTDPETAALYHFDEGMGALLGDESGAAGGPSDGIVAFGGDPVAPQWSDLEPW